ncbi:MAG TPA: EAL domain-containing response regulator [Campylobacterales bacterium]|nr:EAL domain-containing response regulator [Campylobacterales bacterium]HHS92557.1 EAL domain-containing response regulator [Campylobacterales bacterium]
MHDFSILYIDDDKVAQNLINKLLQTYFKKVYIANDGVDGMQLYHEKNPDIVLSDISMPNMNGLEVAKEIKKYNPYQKIALLTSYNDIDYLNNAINLGVNKYILKPLDSKKMFEDLDELVELLKIEKKEKKYKKKLEFVAQHDELTGLFNRRQFFALWEKLVYRSHREKRVVALLGVDLNKFKLINDTYGHDAGDRVLKRVAENLSKSTRKEDLVARFGGDEFTVAIGFLKDTNEILLFLERIKQAFSEPLVYEEDGVQHKIAMTYSLGITFYAYNHKRQDLEILLRQADRAMYSAKSAKKPYAFFDKYEASKFKIKIQKSKEIQRGLEQGEFLLYYQPVIDIKKREIVSFEALIRWVHPTDGILAPSGFLPYVLDNEEIISYLGQWVIEQVFIQHQKWLDEGYNILLSINISFHELISANFITMLKELLQKYPRVKASQIIFEVIESIALKDLGLEKSTLASLKELGFKVTLDNFGTGLATLSSLNEFQIDSIKIDKSFVMSMLKNKKNHSIVNASIQLAKAFGYVVIAEGVESKQHLPALLELGCDRAQGFGIARPMPADEVELLFFKVS